jgi:glycine/D-amino acid oxidase-like deaminating enzyme
MRATVREPARDLPVFRSCDVLVVGGGPAGSAAAASAAQLGADTMLVERYGHLGGMSTGGFVLWIDRMTDWQGRQVIAGFANDLLDRLPPEAVLGPPPALWGSKDAAVVAYWKDRYNAFQGTVTWSPTVDPEMLKMASLDLVLARGVSLLLHAWVVAVVQEGDEVRGAIFESKSGRQAILAKVVVDATGDGDVFALGGGRYETDTVAPDAREEFEFVVPPNIHDRMTLSSRWGGVDMDRYLAFRNGEPERYQAVMARARREGVVDRPHVMPRNDVALFMAPKMSGYSCLDVEHLTAVEIEGRRRVRQLLDFYRREMPGFERAWLIDTSPQIGTRHSRRLEGVKRMTRDAWTAGLRHADEVGMSPSPNARYPNVSIPLGCLVPTALDGLLAAGRNLSSDTATHSFMREIPQCWAMGQAAGVAAAVAVAAGVRVRDVDVTEVQRQLAKQGVWRPEGSAPRL